MPSRSIASGSATWFSDAAGAALIQDAAAAAAWLESLIDFEKRPDFPYARLSLDPIRRLLARLGDPQRDLSVIHIAGSKGKGSTALFAESLLRAAGERVGTFTSPHLERWTERFRIDGDEVPGSDLAAAVRRLAPEVEALRAQDPGQAPTFFDATTAAALWLFREARVDRVVLEVGLGGRLDSTNAVTPAVACITTIELEHTDKLGDTLAAIAGEKAGILKPGVPAVAGALPEPARKVVEMRAHELGAPLAWLGEDFHAEVLAEDDRGLRLALRDGPLELEASLSVLGAHQAANAALALACVRRAGVPDAVLAETAPEGLAAARLPGRAELLSREPWILVDGAHTAASARALARVIERLPRRHHHLVLSVSSGKDLDSILDALLPTADQVTVTRAEPTRSQDPAAIAAAVSRAAPGLEIRVVPNPHLALRAAAEALAPGHLLCAAGSVYLAGIARGVLGQKPLDGGQPQP
jgi:dihydrofolate synthase/folylpolyglutamate synthase